MTESLADKDDSLERWGRCALWFASFALLLVTPLAMSTLFMALTLNRSIFEAAPVWNDELIYWHGINTFIEAGFNGGYYTFNELTAKAAFTHFDAHGPVFFMVIGLLSAMGTWSAALAITINLLLLAAGSAVFAALVRPTVNQLLLTAITVGSSWIVVLFIPMTMQESLHLAIAMVMAGILHCGLREDEEMGRGSKIASVVFILSAGLIRPLWTFVLFGLCYCWSRERPRRFWFLNLVLPLSVIPLTFYLFMWCSAPYPSYVFSRHLMKELFSNPPNGVRLLIEHAVVVFRCFGQGLFVECAVRQQVLLVLCFAVLSIWATRRKSLHTLMPFLLPKSQAYTQVLSLGTLAVFIFSVHDIFDLRDYRVFAPHLLAAHLLLIATRQYALVTLLLFLNFMTFSSAVDAYPKLNSARYNVDQVRMNLFSSSALKHIRYDRNAKSGWCNTMLTQAYDRYQFPPEVALLPAGFGFSVILNDEGLSFPLKSQYLFIDEERAIRLTARMRLELLENLGKLKLYRNIDAGC
jgi:hypothetical protein